MTNPFFDWLRTTAVSPEPMSPQRLIEYMTHDPAGGEALAYLVRMVIARDPTAERTLRALEWVEAQAAQGRAPERGMLTDEETLLVYLQAVRAELQED